MVSAPAVLLFKGLTLASAFTALAGFCINLRAYRPPQRQASAPLPPLSVLIPARNEEAGIIRAVESVLASTGVTLELLVLDDASTDRTAELVNALAAHDGRVALHHAPTLPAGWNGKQHACAALAKLARHDRLCFLDADVRLAPDALHALLSEQERMQVDLLSGFPLEETGTWLEKLLIPLIHFVLLCYLPLPFSQARTRDPALAAGCGQIMLARRAAYRASGGHGAIRETMHDGLLLPRLFRQHGFATGICDLTALARCRMYRNAGEVWRGLMKNATEGMAAPARIVPFSALLFLGQVAPLLWLLQAVGGNRPLVLPAAATVAGFLIRMLAAVRFRQSFLGVLLHPVSIAILLVLQWWSLAAKLLGRRAVWKERAYDVG